MNRNSKFELYHCPLALRVLFLVPNQYFDIMGFLRIFILIKLGFKKDISGLLLISSWQH